MGLPLIRDTNSETVNKSVALYCTDLDCQLLPTFSIRELSAAWTTFDVTTFAQFDSLLCNSVGLAMSACYISDTGE